MKAISFFLSFFLILSGSFDLYGQSPQTAEEMLTSYCPASGNLEHCDFAIQANFSFEPLINSIECGEWLFSANFEIIKGEECIHHISKVEWEYTYTKEFKVGEHTTFLIKRYHENIDPVIKVLVSVSARCGSFTFEYYYTIMQPYCPEACSSSFCYEELGPPVGNPIGDSYELHGLRFFYNDNYGTGYFVLNENNNFGIFNFPYIFYSDLCDIRPNMIDFITDMNIFLDLAKNHPENPAFRRFYGHAFLVYSYNPPFDGCKLRIKIVNSGMLLTHYWRGNRDIVECELKDPLWNWNVKQVSHIYSYDCLIHFSLPESLIYHEEDFQDKAAPISNDNSRLALVYPSISSGIVTIESLIIDDDLYINVYNSNGHRTGHFFIDKDYNKKTLYLNHMPPGFYLIEIYDHLRKNRQIEKLIFTK